MKVAKFGGSSLADAKQFSKVKRIVDSDPDKKIIVVSAAGKSIDEPKKMTDMLLDLEGNVQRGLDYQDIWNSICQRILSIRDSLRLNIVIEQDLDIIKRKLSNCSHDYLISRGEFLTAKLMATYLNYHFVDAKNIFVFQNDDIDYQASQSRLSKILKKNPKIVVPGFYGANVDGSIHLMPRGGSDISGAVLANISDAALYENWTDVSGILRADPRIIGNSQRIDKLTYEELQELSYMGFNVFQQEAIQPVRRKGIPTKILNTNHPESGGTLVESSCAKFEDNQLITGIAGRKNYIVITVKKYQLNRHIDVLQRIFSVFQKLKISVNYVPSGNDGFSFLCQKKDIFDKLTIVISTLKSKCNLDSVKVNKNIALVAAVSSQISKRPAIAGKIINYLDDSLIKVRFVFQEGSDIKIVFGVSNDDYEKTIEQIYQKSMDGQLNKVSA